MSALNIDRSTACSFSGHRIVAKNFNKEELKKTVYNAINDGFSCFLIGMAIGFDTLCFKVLREIRSENDIKIIACVPCKDQAEFFNRAQKKEYEELLSSADHVVCLAENYYDGCMQERNKFMVDNSSLLICYLKTNRGGTYSTVKYAVEKGVKVIYLDK